MTAQELRQKFLKFFEKNNHVFIPSASLVPSEEEQLSGKERVLFTSAGMQPLIPYLLGKPHPQGKRLANVQKCLRTDDIEEVGDSVHHTFFEMLGNWSLGDYWKDEAIRLSFQFLTKELEIPIEKLAVSVFAGDEDAPKDDESAKVWENLGIPQDRIFYFGKEYNWWPTGEKLGPCGSDTEMFYWTGEEKPTGKPNEQPLWVEIWNDVFMEFNRTEEGTVEELPQKNVDTGMGLERTIAVLNGKQSDYETDLFEPIIQEIRKSKNNYSEKSERIIADHLKAAAFLIAAGIKPDPKDKQGSVVVRLITNAVSQGNKLIERGILKRIIEAAISIYKDPYPELTQHRDELIEEINNFSDFIAQRSTGQVQQNLKVEMSNQFTPSTLISTASVYAGTIAYDYHQSRGIPQPVAFGTAQELIKEKGLDWKEFERGYQDAFKKHQQASRWIPAGRFAGGLAGHSETEIKYHTATHLLHQALRDVLGPQVFQQGSNITAERLRFDFSFDRKMTEEEIKQVEDIINKRIKEDLKVDQMVVSLDEAKKMDAIGLFDEKYAEKVSIYGLGPGYKLDPKAKDTRARGGYYSLEFCGGPHVEHTAVIGGIKITKEEAISAGVRRIRAEVVLR